MLFSDFHEAERRGVRAFVRATQPETRDTRCGSMDLSCRTRRTYRLGCYDLHSYVHAVLVARTPLLGMDIYRSIRRAFQHNKVNKYLS